MRSLPALSMLAFATAVLAAADTLYHEDPHLVAIEKGDPVSE